MFYFYNRICRAKLLAKELRVSSVFPYQHRFIHRRKTMPRGINWGIAHPDNTIPQETLNYDLSVAISKVRTFQALDTVGVRHPPLLTMEEAVQWPHGYLGRRDGLSGGRGITIYQNGQPPTLEHDFLVGIVPIIAEYRIHVFRPSHEEPYRIIARQQKIGVMNASHIIHNYNHGITFSLQDLRLSDRGKERADALAVSAVSVVGLDFGAVDLAQDSDHHLHVLEVNSAPALRTDSLFACYLEAFRSLVQE